MSLTPSQPSASHHQHPSASPAPEGTPPPPQAAAGVAFNISNEETIRRLRAKGQPIRLFGEADKDRRLRLRALELIEEKGHERVGGQNDFRKALEDVESAERLMRDRNANSTADEGKGKKKDESASGDGEIAVLDLALVKTDPDKLYPVIYYALKSMLKEWGESLGERPGKDIIVALSFIFPVDTNLRTCEKHASRKAGSRDPSAVRTVPQAPLQVATIEGVSTTFRNICISRRCSYTRNLSPSRMTCWPVYQRSYTICKNVSTSEPTTHISVSRLAMPPGLLGLPWLGRSTRLGTGFSFLNADPCIAASPVFL